MLFLLLLSTFHRTEHRDYLILLLFDQMLVEYSTNKSVAFILNGVITVDAENETRFGFAPPLNNCSSN
jgi:hypothetical protein